MQVVHIMKKTNEKFGQNAGKVWVTLNSRGQLNETNLLKNTSLTTNDLYIALGWLARENKIFKNGSFYKLGETNLTNKIGEDAGKVWKTLENQKEVDISSIANITNLKVSDAYSAIGWLAREDKIHIKKTQSNNNNVWVKLK